MAVFRAVRVLYKDRLAFWLLNLSVLVIIATWSLFLFHPVQPDPLAVLHFNIYAGIDVIGHSRWLYFIPLIGFVLSILDFVFAVFVWTKQRILSYYFLVALFITNVFIFLYLFNILSYNA